MPTGMTVQALTIAGVLALGGGSALSAERENGAQAVLSLAVSNVTDYAVA